MKNQYTSYAGIIKGIAGTPIGLPFPIDVGYKTINGPESWKLYLKDQEMLREANDLLVAHIRGEIPYKEIRHLVEAEPLPEPECNCFLPEQSCSICNREGMDTLKMTGEEF